MDCLHDRTRMLALHGSDHDALAPATIRLCMACGLAVEYARVPLSGVTA